MANIKVIKAKQNNSLRSMLYRYATNGMTELQELAYNNLKKGLENEEVWATKLFHDNMAKIWDKSILKSVDLSDIDFNKYTESKNIPELCMALSRAALVNEDNSMSLTDVKDMISILSSLKTAVNTENSAVNLSDEQLRAIHDVINNGVPNKDVVSLKKKA
jgi:hypothetical protein